MIGNTIYDTHRITLINKLIAHKIVNLIFYFGNN